MRKITKINDPAKTRLAAIEMLQSGATQREVAEKFGIHQTTVGEWVKIYQQGGPGALTIPLKPRPKHELDPEQIQSDLRTYPQKYHRRLGALLDLATTNKLNQTAEKHGLTPQGLAKQRREYLAGKWKK